VLFRVPAFDTRDAEVAARRHAKNKLKRPIDTSLDALAQWQQQLNAALVKAAQAANDYAAFKAELKGVQKKLDDAEPQFADQPQYLEALQARLDACLAAGKAEGQLAGEQDVLKQIDGRPGPGAGGPRRHEGRAAAGVGRRELKKQDKATWKACTGLSPYTTLPQVRKLADGAAGQGDRAAGPGAQQTFSKTADLAVARQQLQLAIDRAEDAIAYSRRQGVHFRKALGPGPGTVEERRRRFPSPARRLTGRSEPPRRRTRRRSRSRRRC
jgi:hypothetical protein